MLQSNVINIVILIVLIMLLILLWGLCFYYYKKIKSLRQAEDRLNELNPAYEKCAKLHSDFRVIRHDFANYVQAAGALDDEEGLKLVKQQKMAVRKLVTDWNTNAESFMREQERDLWNT